MNHKDNIINSIISKRNILDSRMNNLLRMIAAMGTTVERDNFMEIEIIITTLMTSKMKLTRAR